MEEVYIRSYVDGRGKGARTAKEPRTGFPYED